MSNILNCVYRMTHIENIPHILQYGITHRLSRNANPKYKSIGDVSLIRYRDTKKVLINKTEIILGDYIPFYFGVRMPMLYVIQHGGNCVEHPVPPSEIIYIAVSIEKIANSNIEFIFSNGHATDSFTSFYTRSDLFRLSEIIDIKAIKARQWSGENIDMSIKRKKQAEFLVKSDVPPEYIVGYVCYDESAKLRLINMGISEDKIKIQSNAYY